MTRTVNLPEDVESYLSDALNERRFATVDEILSLGVRLLREREADDREALSAPLSDEARAKIREGLA